MNSSIAQNPNLSIEERFLQLQIASERPEVDSKPKIQRVAHQLVGDGKEHYEKHFTPKLVSLGPIHYGAPKLQAGEQYKQIWASKFISSNNQSPQFLFRKIAENFEALKELFAPDLFTGNHLFWNYSGQLFSSMEEMICWTLLVDACALLHILEHANLSRPEEMNVKVEQLILVVQDVLLLENQLPYPLLQLLGGGTNEVELIQTMNKFLIRCDEWAAANGYKRRMELEAPTHLLHLKRSIILYDSPPKHTTYVKTSTQDFSMTYRNIMELKAVGVEVKLSKTRSPRDVSFSHGRFFSILRLPEMVVDDATASFTLNLIAYEMCPDFDNDSGIRDYISFMKSLIETPNDVKALRSARVLMNALGSDQDVLHLFTTLSRDLVSNMGNYGGIMLQIEKHYRHKFLPTWIALTYLTYFRNPIAFLAATLGLILTFIQTWYSVHPKK